MNEQLLLEEYRSLRSQIDYQIKEARDLERNVLIATGLTYAWLASVQAPSLLALPAWTFPFILALIGRDRAGRINRRIDSISKYISEIEKSMHGQSASGGSIGWETRILDSRTGGKSLLGTSQRRYWNLLLVGTFLVLVYGVSIHAVALANTPVSSDRRPAVQPAGGGNLGSSCLYNSQKSSKAKR